MAEYKFLIKKMKSVGMEDDNSENNLDKMIEYVKEGNDKMKALRDLVSREIENRKLMDKEEHAKKEEEELKLKNDKVHIVVNRLIAEISLIEKDLMKVKDISVSDSHDSELLDLEQTEFFEV